MQSENFVLTLSGAVRGIDLESAISRILESTVNMAAPCNLTTAAVSLPNAERELCSDAEWCSSRN